MARLVLALLVLALSTACSSTWKSKSASDKKPTATASASGGSTIAPRGPDLPAGAGATAKMDPKRTILEVDCSKPVDFTQGGNLRCKK